MESPIILFVQAHGGGSDKLDNKFVSFNSYRQSTSALPSEKKTNPLFPVITRIVSPMRLALTDFDSDRANVNFLYNIFTNPKTRSHILKLPNTRHAHGAYSKKMEGARSQGELIKNISLFRSEDIIFNEMVSVELHKKSGDIHYKEGGEEDPGGFGIWMHFGNQGWQYQHNLSRILIDELTGTEKDISILNITNKLVTILRTNKIVVVFPNCSPIGDSSYTTATKRAMWERIRVASNRLKTQINPVYQFKLAVEINARIKNFFEGQERFQEFLRGDGFSSSDGEAGASKSGASKSGASKSGMLTEDRIGIIDNEDMVLLIQLFFYFLKDYYDWINLTSEIEIPEVKYILGMETIPKNINIAKFMMCLLLLSFKCREQHGGIIFDNIKGREYLWTKILEQSKYGPIGRNNKRDGHDLDNAMKEQSNLFTFVEKKFAFMNTTDPAIQRHDNYKTLLQFAIEFAKINSKGGRKKKTFKKIPFSKKGKKNKRRKKKSRRKKGGKPEEFMCPPNTQELIWDDFGDDFVIGTPLFMKVKNARRSDPIPVTYVGKVVDIINGNWYITVNFRNTNYNITSTEILNEYVKICLPLMNGGRRNKNKKRKKTRKRSRRKKGRKRSRRKKGGNS
jgi:hypothetical protein